MDKYLGHGATRLRVEGMQVNGLISLRPRYSPDDGIGIAVRGNAGKQSGILDAGHGGRGCYACQLWAGRGPQLPDSNLVAGAAHDSCQTVRGIHKIRFPAPASSHRISTEDVILGG